MRASATWRQRFPSALMALAMQVGLFLLLLYSFRPMELPPEAGRETILLLPRLPSSPPPVVIDARKKPDAGASPPVNVAPSESAAPAEEPFSLQNLPPYARPPSNEALLAALGRALACRPDVLGQPTPFASCRPMAMWRPGMQSEPRTVGREESLAAELAKARTPPKVPCTSTRSYG